MCVWVWVGVCVCVCGVCVSEWQAGNCREREGEGEGEGEGGMETWGSKGSSGGPPAPPPPTHCPKINPLLPTPWIQCREENIKNEHEGTFYYQILQSCKESPAVLHRKCQIQC